MGERGERGPGKDEGAFGKMTLPTIPWPEVLPGTQPHRRPKPGLPGASCCCPVLSLLGSDDTPQKACPADTCPDGPGDRERGASGITVSMAGAPWETQEETHAGPNQCSPGTPQTIFPASSLHWIPEHLAACVSEMEKLVQFGLKGSLSRNIHILKDAQKERTMLTRKEYIRILDVGGRHMFR